MVKYTFDYTDLDASRDYFISQLNHSNSSDHIYFPSDIAEGYLAFYKISPEVFLIIHDYTANKDITYVRKPSEEKDIILHFKKYSLDHTLENDQMSSVYSEKYNPGNIRCIDASYGEELFINKGAVIRSAIIVLKSSYSKPFLEKNKELVKNLNSYIKHSHKESDKFYLSYKQSKLFDQIVQPDITKVENPLFYVARGVRLLETFWKDVIRWGTEENPYNINNEQVGRIFTVSDYLKENIKEPFLGVDQLAHMAHMSRTNFFNMFKEIQNQTPLEFFNNKRLEAAYSMIFVEGMTIKEVMGILNYSNSSKFRKSFFNKFEVNPDTSS